MVQWGEPLWDLIPCSSTSLTLLQAHRPPCVPHTHRACLSSGPLHMPLPRAWDALLSSTWHPASPPSRPKLQHHLYHLAPAGLSRA